jgi:hypothetical protein
MREFEILSFRSGSSSVGDSGAYQPDKTPAGRRLGAIVRGVGRSVDLCDKRNAIAAQEVGHGRLISISA